MNRPFLIFAFLFGVFPLSTVILSAQSIASEIIQMPELLVVSEGGADLSKFSMERTATGTNDVMVFARDLSDILADFSGVSFQSRGANALEPNIRGLGLDRISTRFNGLPLFNSTPTRTGAPINFFGPGVLGAIKIEGGLLTVTEGPVTIGPRLSLQSLSEHMSPESHLGLRLFGHRGGQQVEGVIREDAGPLTYQIGAHAVAMGDYTAGDGRTVSAEYEAWSAGLAICGAWDGRHELEVAVHYFNQILARNSALPLDTKDTAFWATTANYALRNGSDLWKIRLGASQIKPFLTSEDRPLSTAVPVALITNHATTRSVSGGLSLEHEFGDNSTFEIGTDAEFWERDAIRSRHLKSGTVLTDRIWPDVVSEDFGFFAQASGTLANEFSWRLGGRIDHTASEARAGDSLVQEISGALGSTVEENFLAFNGPDATSAKQEEWCGALNLLLARPLGDHWSFHCGLGHTIAPAGVTEKYRAFLSALGGGVELGNPSLKAERKTEAVLGLRRTGAHFTLHAEVFAASIDDFVYRQIIDETNQIYSYRNRSARFWGGECSGQWFPTANTESGWSVPFRFAVVHGEDASTGIRLPEIAPWELSVATQWAGTWGRTHIFAAIESELIGAQTNPAPDNDPLYSNTSSTIIWNARLGLETPWGFSFELALENAFDRLSYAYLQPPVATGIVPPASGDLSQGERIPNQGSRLNAVLRWSF